MVAYIHDFKSEVNIHTTIYKSDNQQALAVQYRNCTNTIIMYK